MLPGVGLLVLVSIHEPDTLENVLGHNFISFIPGSRDPSSLFLTYVCEIYVLPIARPTRLLCTEDSTCLSSQTQCSIIQFLFHPIDIQLRFIFALVIYTAQDIVLGGPGRRRALLLAR